MESKIKVNRRTLNALKLIHKDILNEFITRLDSGLYKEGFSRLRTNTEYTALGVLGDIVKDDIGYEWDNFYNDLWNYRPIDIKELEIRSFSLPTKLYKFIGFDIKESQMIYRKVESFIDKVYYERGFKGVSKILKKIQSGNI